MLEIYRERILCGLPEKITKTFDKKICFCLVMVCLYYLYSLLQIILFKKNISIVSAPVLSALRKGLDDNWRHGAKHQTASALPES